MNAHLPPVLVVDDEKNMRLSLQTVLADEGYSVRAVESAEAALGLLAQEDFFMVITDARLGGMSGYEFLAKIRAQWPKLPALMITAYATPKLAVEAIKSGADAILIRRFGDHAGIDRVEAAAATVGSLGAARRVPRPGAAAGPPSGDAGDHRGDAASRRIRARGGAAPCGQSFAGMDHGWRGCASARGAGCRAAPAA